MSNLLQEYKDYYRVRYERYKDDPDYPNIAANEKKIHEAMESCNELEEFRDKLGNLNELNAVCLVKDQEQMRLNHFQEMKEDVRALAPKRILTRAANATTPDEIITISMEETNKNSIEISMDEAVREFHDWKLLEDLEIYETAEIPDKWKSDYAEYASDCRKRIKERFTDLEKNNESWEAGWKLNLDLNLEPRHRRLLPYPDEEVTSRLQTAKEIYSNS